MKELHPKQKEILRILRESEGEPLTIREMGVILGMSSPSHVHHHIKQLEKKGYLKRDPNNSSNYLVFSEDRARQISYLPLYGMAQCGPNGFLLDGRPIQRIPVSRINIPFPPEEAFLLKAKGDSMEPDLYDGDIVISKKTRVPENKKVMVCVNDDKVLIKKLHADDVGPGKSKWLLTSFNSNIDPIRASKNFHVEGIVRGILFRAI